MDKQDLNNKREIYGIMKKPQRTIMVILFFSLLGYIFFKELGGIIGGIIGFFLSEHLK